MAKRTAEDATLSTPAAAQAEEAQARQGKKRKADSSAAKATKAAKSATTAPRRTRKAKEPADTVDPPQQPQRKRVSKALVNKIKQIKSFRDDNGLDNDILSRSEASNNHIVLVDTALTGALTAMAADWGVDYTHLTALLETEGAIIEKLNKRHDYENDSWRMPMLVLDLDKTTTLESFIHAKIEGHGVENINLLQVNLEMYTKQLISYGQRELLHATEKAELWTDQDDERSNNSGPPISERSNDNADRENITSQVGCADAPKGLEALKQGDDTSHQNQEIKHHGVCPPPEKDL